MHDRPASQRLRIGRRSEPGRLYLITFTTAGRARWFDDWSLAATAARALSASRSWPSASLWCWVLMPDHWHGLVAIDHEPLPRVLARAKAEATRELVRMLGRPIKPWAPGFHDHALRRDEDARQVARYVIANPLRAGLVQRIGDYPYWDAVWLSSTDRSCGLSEP